LVGSSWIWILAAAVWAKFYARSFGKAQRQEARRRMLEHGFGDVR
jgi:hypothetical protein